MYVVYQTGPELDGFIHFEASVGDVLQSSEVKESQFANLTKWDEEILEDQEKDSDENTIQSSIID